LVKATFYSVFSGSAEGYGLLRRNDYGEATALQIKQKCKEINDKNTI
jgi:hypothetical protein